MTTTPAPKPLITSAAIGLPAKPPAAPVDPLADILTTSTSKLCMLVYGGPGTGKTRGALTFPNPIIIDIDHNLPDGLPNVVPLWNAEYVDKRCPRKHISIPNRRDALMIILQRLVTHAPANSTIIVDSISRLENYFDAQEAVEPQPMSKKTNEVDGFELFRRRLDYFNGIMLLLSSSGPDCIVICHEQRERNEKGDLTQLIKPALKGQMGDKLPGHFSTVVQALRIQKASTVEYVWRCIPGLNEPARVAGCTEQFLPQDYNAIKKYL